MSTNSVDTSCDWEDISVISSTPPSSDPLPVEYSPQWEDISLRSNSPNSPMNSIAEKLFGRKKKIKTQLHRAVSLEPGEDPENGGEFTASLSFPQMGLTINKGTLRITNYRVYFMYQDEHGQWTCKYTSIPLCCVATISTTQEPPRYSYISSYADPTEVTIKTKDMRSIRFNLESTEKRKDMVQMLERLVYWNTDIGKRDKIFAFTYRLKSQVITNTNAIYNPHAEFERLKLSEQFEVCDWNKEFKICGTYPKYVFLPKTVTRDDIEQSSVFRSNRRFPAVCWAHPETKAVIARCSQPLTGISSAVGRGNESEGDQSVVTKICLAGHHNTNNIPQLCIIDARSKLAAKCNYALGGGHENPEKYMDCELKFMDIGNIHQIRSSFTALVKLCYEPTSPERFALDQTGWIGHIKALLEASNYIVESVRNGKSVLVHCSDGWDRTTQLVSLSQILLDPYYRTLEGFGKLIQKEWLEFGHKFEERLGYGVREDNLHSEIAPIFVQFIDAVYQILQFGPNWFEFNEAYLLTLLDQLYSGRFGTFLCNCPKEREDEKINEKTLSLWPWLMLPKNIEKFENPCVIKEQSGNIIPPCSTSHLHFWSGYYERYKLVMMPFHKHNWETLELKKSFNRVRREHELLNEQIEKQNLEIAKREKQILELLICKPRIKEIVESEIKKLKEAGINQNTIEFVLDIKDGKIACYLKKVETKKDNRDTPKVKTAEGVNLTNIVENIHEDYKPLITYNSPKNENITEKITSVNVDDENFVFIESTEEECNDTQKKGILFNIQEYVCSFSTTNKITEFLSHALGNFYVQPSTNAN